jgi:hypothetical protein
MLEPVSPLPASKSLDLVEADVLPTLSALLGSVTDSMKENPATNLFSKSDELRDMSRQIIELTQFLAAFTGVAGGQGADARIRA